MTITDLISTNIWSSNNIKEKAEKRHIENKNGLPKAELMKIAEKELREDENSRTQCLENFREWIEKNEDVVNCIKDDNFLLRFLRVKKFSIPMAQQTLLKYLNFRKRFKEFMYDMDFEDEKVWDLINKGYIYVSPQRDAKGRRVIMYNLSKFDPHLYNGMDMAKAHIITYETLLENEETQILGVCHLADLRGVTPAFLTLFSIADFATIIRWGEQSYPMRHKEIHLLNIPHALKYVYDFAKTNMSSKIRERLTIHNSPEDVQKKIGRICLSTEFGGETSTEIMIEMWRRELEEKKNRLLSYDNIELLSDRGIIKRRNPQKEDSSGSLPGSFRKLQVD